MIKKVLVLGLGIVIAVGIALGVRYLVSLNNYKKEVAAIIIKDVNLNKVADGEYIGAYDVNFVAAKVQVNVKNHRITSIKLLKHKTERGKKAEVIPGRVVKAQSLKVDTITGATNSSKVILKAIEKALESGEKA
ncbi:MULTISPECIES: FMN-binding protein [Clostridium]|uniref:FMN-binding protein n=1 Tax=Clostridium TaxID=1485 RepID=UPI00082638FA|nr:MULTISPECIES: FMN-binding protein [Clostridium]PJI09309.1 FMN-binding protein [Clostridium sp. CT7]